MKRVHSSEAFAMFAKLNQTLNRNGENSASEPGTVSRATWVRLISVFGPLLVLVVLMRLLQYSFTVRTDATHLGLVLVSASLVPFLLLCTSAAIYAWSRARWSRWHPVWHFIAVSLVTVLLMIGTSMVGPSWTTEWLSRRAFEAIRWDVLMLLVLALTFLLLLEHTRGWVRIVSVVILYALIPPLTFLPAATFGYFVSTGSPADVTLLRYFLMHVPDLMEVISSEIYGGRILLVFSPLLLLAPPLLLLRIPALRRWAYTPKLKSAEVVPWHALLGAIPMVLMLTLLPITSLPALYPPSLYESIIGELVEKATPGTRQHQFANQDIAPPFDTYGLRLAETDSTRRMNVVMIFLESTRARSTTPYNHEIDTTPFLDSLAQQSLLIEQMYAVVPYTNKSLTPLLAGIPPFPHRDILSARPGGIPGPGLPALLHPYGYRSAFFSPATLAYEHKDRILKNLGFEEMYGGDTLEPNGFAKTNYFGHEDRVVIQPSMDWVDARVSADEPFFMGYLTLVAHHPYIVPPTFAAKDYGVDDPSYNHYLNALRYTDDFLRELMGEFARRGLLESTLFIITGDHGQGFGEHKQRMHADVLWDEALHVPALLYNPVLFPEPGRITGARQQIDFLPTIADALGLRLEGGMPPGSSLLQPVPDDRTLYFSGWESDIVLAMRQDGMKFICRYKRYALEIFDTHKDPLEEHNLTPTLSPEALQEAQHQMLRWRDNVEQIYTDHQGRSTEDG